MYALKAIKNEPDSSESFYIHYTPSEDGNKLFALTDSFEEATKFDDSSDQTGYILAYARKIFDKFKICSVSFSSNLPLHLEKNIYVDVPSDEMPEDMRHFILYGHLPNEK